MPEIEYRETQDSAILETSARGEWLESDSIVLLADWN
jgi:hypothetical protein